MVMIEKFPLDSGLVSWNTTIKQMWSVEESKTASGKRRTLIQQTYPSWTFSLKFPALTKEQIDLLCGFYAKKRGRWDSFLYKDFENHHMENVELLKQGEQYYCITNLQTMFEPCYGVENLHVFIDGVETTNYQEENGIITLNDVGGIVTATYDYYYLVCFGNNLEINQIFDNIYTVGLQLEVVRE